MTRSGLTLPLNAWHPAWGPRPGTAAPVVARPVQSTQPGRSTVSGAGR